jgi:hypothetical protein
MKHTPLNPRDGRLDVLVGQEPIGWHLSTSHKRVKPNGDIELRRYPTWDEIVHARDHLLPADRAFVMHLPKAGEFVALHHTTFHLHELIEETR